jgi:hypothetical protein
MREDRTLCPSAVVFADPESLIVFAQIGEIDASLRGRHFNITVVHEPGGAEVLDSAGELLPRDQWSGFIIDMIEWIAPRANFTYSLHTPSGRGSACVHAAGGQQSAGSQDTTAGAATQYARQYNCGVNDVTDLHLCVTGHRTPPRFPLRSFRPLLPPAPQHAYVLGHVLRDVCPRTA